MLSPLVFYSRVSFFGPRSSATCDFSLKAVNSLRSELIVVVVAVVVVVVVVVIYFTRIVQ